MKTLIVLASLLLLVACEKPTEPPVENKPSITILELYGNDAIDATVVYSVNPDGITFLIRDDDTLQVTKTAERTYEGIFPAPPPTSQREIVLIAEGTQARKSF